jgi:hypothetical protein
MWELPFPTRRTRRKYATAAAPPSNNDNDDDAAVDHATVAGYSMSACDYFRVHEMYARSMETVVSGLARLVECLTGDCVNHDRSSLSQAPAKPSCPAPPAATCRPLHRIRLASASRLTLTLRTWH